MTTLFTNRLSKQDIIFLINAVDHRLLERIDIIKDDPIFIESILEGKTHELLHRIMVTDTNKLMIMITPRLLFEILLRTARKELATRTFTMERSGLEKIPVFDATEANDFIRDENILKYLADMLTSFTRIKSYTWPVRVRKGIWRRIRFNDMDIHSLKRFCEVVDEEHRFELYKRIADLCLFILGMFPEYLTLNIRYSSSRNHLPNIFGRRSYSAEYYEEEGRKFYRLAGEHQNSKIIGQDHIFRQLHEHFDLAKKPLNYISEHYLLFRKGRLFPSGSTG